jgi:uncharacterized protein
MNKLVLFLFATMIPALGLIAQTTIANKQPFTIGETVSFRSVVLNEERELNIYLPVEYKTDSLKKFPVIYLLDGSADEDFIHISGLVQFGSFSWINMIPPSIVVGIANVDRRRDFTWPTRNKKDRQDNPSSGGSAAFRQFLEKELIPLVQNQYRTDSNRTLIGQSLGGLLAAQILVTSPRLFNNYIIISPSLWWDDGSLLKNRPALVTPGRKVYIGVGKEGALMENDARSLARIVRKRALGNSRVWFQYFGALNHANILHQAVYDAFEKLFAPMTTNK